MMKKLSEVYRKEYPVGDYSNFGYAENGESKATSNGNGHAKTAPSPSSDMSPEEMRALDKKAIRKMLLDSISQIANIDIAAINDAAPLNSFMDSVTIAQYKGLLEGQYGVKPMSDGYLFQDSATVKKLVEVVKVGQARDDTGEGGSGKAGAGGKGPGCCGTGCTIM